MRLKKKLVEKRAEGDLLWFGKRNYGGLDERLMVRNSYQFLSVQAKQFDNDNKLITESGRGTV
ncbi:hypothetical protein Phum_PHUM590760 [Pediculus humanus corporis]|uniref:Uncharacterized protein n=1 Tax=Pediculus humanus subsp. corporis TaxID=121224 RepID=E0W2E3_PEDHC|nr:uncharacterized protein Phum_PHUM590760 [Pediculus humanus corporis]EEB19799.1 hypothetical protein Phum_PHUM590760 [Pediculus humanus corporis]